jgi:hypothetical protein
MNRQTKINFIFQHPKSKEKIISSGYTIEEAMEEGLEEIRDKHCRCNCEPTGETNVIECNCEDYYNDFELLEIEEQK